MKSFAVGVWGTSHWFLDGIGRGACWLLHAKATPHDDEAYAMTGGGILGAIYGVTFGFLLSTESHSFNATAGTIFGGLMGICTGIITGAVVQIVDDYIDDAIDSLNSR